MSTMQPCKHTADTLLCARMCVCVYDSLLESGYVIITIASFLDMGITFLSFSYIFKAFPVTHTHALHCLTTQVQLIAPLQI